ncbi:Glycine dehydrogenase (decarboxylating) [Zhongshania aliphaticivorans]|uniref:Glycine dehydrogenase (decarboxylating) n=1 Tax=Zhongshania aliphaticivorans TaxID=1470434 RepID=A0A5S9MN34_9GAMM|nr:aminomethyl-transferring glycine dehydrogenase [Zhongshania aliphaticivorans]CAA0078345.1 Glycine dehydrogenase (decarboxylating) [Zhongshania aliphaticivorans]CAA0086720.1 Glycine dehydrogenase (decarboxylating) [Zhongshania aliphaticivorans]
MTHNLSKLSQSDDFLNRHIGPDASQTAAMLHTIGANSLDDLIQQTVPASILRGEMPLSAPQSETTTLNRLRKIAAKNQIARSFIGAGYHGTITPPVILRNVLENPGWYTAYTPYQPEIAQGRLEALLNFQQMIIDLTGLELANASLLDEATAAAEAMAMCKRSARKNKSNTFFVDHNCHPQTIAVLKTRALSLGLEITVGNAETELADTPCFGVLIQYPATQGHVSSLAEVASQAKSQEAMTVVAADIMSLLLLTPPGEQGADIVVGSAQRFGVPMGFGGPHAAFFATRDSYKRSIPGRIIGVSIDSRGNKALRMAMQTREQHIRREKATSNICTSQALLAIMAVFYAIYHGPDGLKTIAQRINRIAGIFAAGLNQLGYNTNTTFFDTICIATDSASTELADKAEAALLNVRRGDKQLSVSFDETSTAEDIEQLWQIFAGDQAIPSVDQIDKELQNLPGIPTELQRNSSVLTHPVFHQYRSETEMLRYMNRLERKDIALNHSMIALGSCTMKLNATTEMIPITWPEFSNIHPFAPRSQTTGYLELIDELEQQLMACTGYDKFSMQPNAGSQGEYAGLLAIKRYHESRGDTARDICLIPSSAHGTNPASAAMAGMRVVIVSCDALGNVNIDDLKEKAERHADQLAALMVTYPSTHGVFEEGIRDICDITHQFGGQVYVDGANMNALVGLAAPGEFGADVSHLNLHKTFCIPHGGGGPGMGPIGVKAHLASFLPNHPVYPIEGLDQNNDTIAAATFGSAGILPISWAYISLMGAAGLKQATQVAILSANYVATRLNEHYPVLYTGRNGRVAHECIIDLRPLKESTGISEEDIAKRLMDYGFHAPTMSFPVPGTLMIEPTESESKVELDRFCEAMIHIRREIGRIESGQLPADNNPLVNAPHTLADIVGEWNRPYSREEAGFPVTNLSENKYWPTVNRIDNVFGDRNLICSCPPIESYLQD